LLARRRYFAARPVAALATVSVLWGWGAGQYPWLLEEEITIDQAAASRPVLLALLLAFVIAALLALPSLLWLFRLTEGRRLGEGELHPESTEALFHRP
jgi:cytochrome d ubiquinol oxidase subunit II